MILAVGLATLGCARLPEIRYLKVPVTPETTVAMENSHGDVPPIKAEALLTRRRAKSGIDFKERAVLEEAATGRPLLAGNKVRLLFDGPQTMGAMMACIASAKDTIDLETYIFDQDELGQKFADLLMAKIKLAIVRKQWKGPIGNRHWSVMEPVYGSEAYASGGYEVQRLIQELKDENIPMSEWPLAAMAAAE